MPSYSSSSPSSSAGTASPLTVATSKVVSSLTKSSPISAYWTIELKHDHCINEPAHLIAAGTINTVTDFVLVILPVRTVMALELPLKQRIIVIALFSVGLLASAAGVARVYFTAVLTTTRSQDRSWHSWGIWLSSAIELDLGIVSAPQQLASHEPASLSLFRTTR